MQGATGKMGALHTRYMLAYGTRVVAGVTPARGASKVPGTDLPVFDTVSEARDATGATASVVFVPPYLVLDAASEAIDAGMELIVVITEGMPPLDTAKLVAQSRAKGVRIVGPNCPGIITPGETLLGILPGAIFKKGPVGMVSKSGTLTYEIALALSDAGLGQSTCVGIGGDPVKGMDYTDILTLFENDADTEIIVLLGEIGGTAEEEAAEFIKKHVRKPVVAYIAGQTAPPGKRMGHAGAIISGGKGTAESKMKAMNEVGIDVALTPRQVAEKVGSLLRNTAVSLS